MSDFSLFSAARLRSKQDSFEQIRESFQWDIPDQLNVANVVCTRHATGENRLALIAEADTGETQHYSFDDLETLSKQLANVFTHHGVKQGDVVAVVLSQRLETALVHLAAQKIGAISLPLSNLFGDEALSYRLSDSQTRLVVTGTQRADLVKTLQNELPLLDTVLSVYNDAPAKLSQLPINACEQDCFWQALAAQPTEHVSVNTLKDDPAFLLYTSGTTGLPKGALIPQRALIGNLTGFELSHNGFPLPEDRLYTPADWAWTGGLLDGLLPAWFYGVPVLGFDTKKFDADKTASIMSEHKITCAFIPPTALKMLRAVPNLFERHPSHLRSVMSAGEALGDELFHWGTQTLGLEINEMCGQTEHNYLIGHCAAIMDVRPGSMGKAYPGHKVAIMGTNGELLPTGEQGEIVVDCNDPVHFLGYLNKPEATASKYTDNWFHTGDVGVIDADGYMRFIGRADDVISSAGYRIGPGEIEDCVLNHPAVLQVAAIGVPDPDGIRGDIVKLCIVTKQGTVADAQLTEDIRTRVRDKLAAYEYPRIIEYFESFPMTTTGKVRRRELRELHINNPNT